MKENGIGGANTKTGLVFEGKTDLQTFLCGQKGYSCVADPRGWVLVKYNNDEVASIFKKTALYKFLDYRGIDWKAILSKKLLPDDSILSFVTIHFLLSNVSFKKLQGLLMKSYKPAILRKNNIKNF